MKSVRYTEEFKTEALKQVLERGYSQAEVATRLGVAKQTLRNWIQRHSETSNPGPKPVVTIDKDVEIARLKAENRRLTEERDILKKAAAYFANQSE